MHIRVWFGSFVLVAACRHPLPASDSGAVGGDGGGVADGGGADADGGATSDGGGDGGADGGGSGDTGLEVPQEIDWGDCTFEQIAAGYDTTCVLTQSKQIACWGTGYTGSPSGEFQSMSSEDAPPWICGLRPDGQAGCWYDEGEEWLFVTAVPDGSFVQVANFDFSACVLDADGVATCWGDAYEGYGMYEPQSATFSRLDVGADENCGITTGGSVHCWGRDATGWEDDVWNEIVGYEPEGDNFADVRLGDGFACALDTDGNASCWGTDWYYLNAFSTPMSEVRSPYVGGLFGPFQQLSIGGRSSGGCGVTLEGDIECLVYANSTDAIDHVTYLPGPYKQVAYGHDHACALDADGRASCWPINDFGTDEDPQLSIPCEAKGAR